MIREETQSIMASARKVFSGTLLSRFSGLGREILMTALFGTQPAVAAFWMAFRFAHLLRRIFGEGALHTAFVPHFESVKKKDAAQATRFFYDLSIGVVVCLSFLVILAETLFGSLWLCGLVGSETKEVLRLTMILFPGIIFISLYALNTSFLNCEGCYFLPSVAPFFFNLVWITAICLLHRLPASEAMLYLAIVVGFAFILQWMVTLPRVSKMMVWERKHKTAPKQLAVILRPFALGLLGVAATQINSALDMIFSRIADAEGPAYLWYAVRIQQLPLALFGLSVASALLPAISRAIQGEEAAKASQFINMAVQRTWELMLPVMAALYVLGLPVINLVYGRGAFTVGATLQTTSCLQAYGIGLLPMALVLIFAASFYARKNYFVPTVVSLSCVGLNIFLNILFVFVWHCGVVSIAMATTITAFVNAGVLGMLIKEKINWRPAVRLLLCCFFAGCVTYFYEKQQPLSRQFAQQILQLAMGAAVFGITFVASLLVTRTSYGVLGIRKPSEY